jgi:hypothetical protein
MSHHFDTAIAREDPRLNLLDFYLFRGQPGQGSGVFRECPISV